MKTWHLAAVAAVVLALSGCRTDPEISRLERENFYKQREIEKLRWRIEDIEDGVDSSHGPCDATTARPAGSQSCPLNESGPRLGSAADGTPSNGGSWRPAKPVPPASREKSAPPPPPESEINKPPKVEMPEEALPPGQVPPRLRSTEGPAAKPPERDSSAVPADSARVAQITLGKSFTGVSPRDGRGSEVITVLVEPRDMVGNLLAAPADVSVVVVDPAYTAVPVARWDFRAPQTAAMLDRGPHGGIRLDLSWPDDLPAQNGLRLFVRYTTRDGRKLQAERPLDVAAASQRPSGWLPSPRGPTTEPLAPKGAWHPSDGGGTAPSEAEPARMASRPSDSLPRRPVWSPERPN